jgi:hypothetical protein
MDYNYVLKFIGVMVAIFFVDICWAKYFIHVNKHNPLPAASWGSLILVFGAFVTIEYVHDKTLIIPAFIGGFIGTYITVYRERNKAKKIIKKE